MFAAVRADARGTPLTPGGEAGGPRARRAAPSPLLLSETLLQGPGVAGLAEGASTGTQQDAHPNCARSQGPLPAGPQPHAFTLLKEKGLGMDF